MANWNRRFFALVGSTLYYGAHAGRQVPTLRSDPHPPRARMMHHILTSPGP